MDTFWLSVLGLFALAALPAAPLQVGIAMSDITGPAAEITFVSNQSFKLPLCVNKFLLHI